MARKRAAAQAVDSKTAVLDAPIEASPTEFPPTENEAPLTSFAEQFAKPAPFERRKIPDPFSVESHKAADNGVRLMKSDSDRAWVIRFDKNPSQGLDPDGKEYGKENPHPVLKMLKSEGFRWGFSDADGVGGWGKHWQEGNYTWEEHEKAQRVLKKAAEMIDNGKSIPI